MSSNVDFTICPECGAVNAAEWSPHGRRSYDVTCTVCGFEHEHGHYDSARNLTLERFIRESIPSDHYDVMTDDEIGNILLLGEIRDYEDDEDEQDYFPTEYG